MSLAFDPFNDYTARKMRNALSSAFVEEMIMGELHHIQDVVARFDLPLESVYQEYLDHRSQAYGRILHVLKINRMKAPLVQALVVWDEGLFFEVHECLEILWLAADGGLKKTLQALIRAAGLYVHLYRDNNGGALSMAKKAEEGLRLFGSELVSIAPVLPTLCAALRQPITPPRLYEVLYHE